MTLAPVVIFSYNRPNHLQRVLDALSKNDLASESVLYIYCDGAKPLQTEDSQELEGATNTAKRFFKGTKEEYEKYLSDIEENRKVAHSAIGFKEVHVIIRPQNVGLKDNIVGAVTELVNQYGRIITLEDDVVTSHGFLRYMNESLEMYKEDEKVMHITGFVWHHRWPLPQTFFYPVPECGGGWATWDRAWKYYNDNAKELVEYWQKDWTRFNIIGGCSFQKQLLDNYNGILNTWFIKWHAVVMQRNGLTLYPGHSLTTNIGFDGSGTNCTFSSRNPFYYELLADKIQVNRQPIVENRMARYLFYCVHQGRFYSKRNRRHVYKYFRQLFLHM